jgi:hypothetical protein
MDKDIERSEWDFSGSKKLTAPELTACLDWEYLRQIVLFDSEIATRIWHRFLPIELHCPGTIHRRVDGVDDPDFETDRDLSKYFPECPYLTLPAGYRSRLLALRRSRVGYHVGERILETKSGEPVPHIWSDETAGRFEVVSIGIDWSLTDTLISKSFLKIIKARRGERRADDPKGTSPKKLISDRLKRLGALRVWKHWSGNFSEIQHSNAKGLYRSRQAWIKHTGDAAEDVMHFREELENRF